MTSTLSVIVPSTGRPTLARTLASIAPQLLPGDQLLVLCDRSGDWGCTPRTLGMRMATGSHLLFMDDDDVYVPTAFAAIRQALARHPDNPHLFRLWRGAPHLDLIPAPQVGRKLQLANVSTQCFVTPNIPAQLGRWTTRYEGDYDFIVSTVALYPAGALQWHDEVIAIWRP